jgi:hypothetical protein
VTGLDTQPEVPDVPVGQVWDQLVSVALVGTERKPPPTAAIRQVAELVDTPGGETESEPAELSVLRAAAAVAAYRRVGLVVDHSDAPLPDRAATDDRPEASTTASQLLTLLLEGHVRVPGGLSELVNFWLDRCAAGGRRPSHRTLPPLLDHATRAPAVRPAVASVGGARARWLAAQNPKWKWAADAESGSGDASANDDAEVWRTGSTPARMGVLAQRRRHDPAAARALVEETWSGESAKDRAHIVELLRSGLGGDDEPFLEACLDDRSGNVRTTAAELLAALPGSALARRMTDRARPLVDQRRRRLEVALPEQPDAAARRDGIADDGVPPATGRRTWWLIQLIGATPLGFWSGELGLSPGKAVKRAADQAELLQGWVLAASRQSDIEWCRELLRATPDPRLLAALPAAEAHELLPVALERATDAGLAPLLGATPGPWPALLTQWVLHRVRPIENAVARDRALAALATAGDAAVIPELERWIEKLPTHEHLRFLLAEVAHGLSIRQTIAQELQ